MKKLAFFSALCFFLSAVELAIPKPVPFFRMGLANLPVMVSFLCMSKKESAALICLKIFLQAVVSGTLFSYVFLFSLAGSLASGFIMMAVFHLLHGRNLVSWIGISLAGGLANNVAQLGVAYVFLFGRNIKFIAPILLVVSFFPSLAMGLFTQTFVKKSLWLKKMRDPSSMLQQKDDELSSDFSLQNASVKFGVLKIFTTVMLVSALVILFFVDSIFAVYGIFFIALILVLVKKRKVKILPSAMIILSVTFFSLLVPHGKILAEIWKLKITEGALMSGLVRSGRLCGAFFLSKLMVDKNTRLPSKAGLFMNLVFQYFERLSSDKTKIQLKDMINGIDRKLLSVF